MPIIKSAKKALKRSRVLEERNLKIKSEMKIAIKAIKKAVVKGEEKLDGLLDIAYSKIDKAAKRNILHKNNAARKKSQVAKMIGVK